MNFNEALYDPDRVRDEIDSLIAQGMTEDEAWLCFSEDVVMTTKEESERRRTT